MKTPVFTGSSAAIVTPFKNGRIDYESFENLLRDQIEAGSEAVTVCGTTGEGATLTPDEYVSILKFAKDTLGTKSKVIAGSGTNNTATAIEKSKIAQDCGADALLIVTPYYNKTTQAGLISHYYEISRAVDLPIILYNVPSRTGVSFSADTYKTLSEIESINGVKEASGNFDLIAKTRILCGDNLNVWSGNDNETLEIMALGGRGVISVAANLIPKVMMDLTDLCDDCEYDMARELMFKYYELMSAMFVEVNPIPIKAILYLAGKCAPDTRLPLVGLGSQNEAKVRKIFEKYKSMGLI